MAPIVYQKYFKNTEYVEMFFYSQFVHVIQGVFMLILALRWNEQLGIPDLFIFLVFGALPDVIEKLLVMLPNFIIMAKIIPPGIEGTMMSLTDTIINLGQFTLRQLFGVILNDVFVGCTKEKIDLFWILCVIQLACKIIPFVYISQLVPRME